MATYVLVHGSFQGGWIWQRVARGLRAAGHEVYHPSLDGCAERAGSLRPEITSDSQGREIAGLISYEDLRDVILVGTSSGGIIVSRAAELVPDRIRRIVFIDALVPMPGESTPIINSRPPYPPGELAYGPAPDQARGKVFTDLEPELQDWALARYTRQPVRPNDDPVDHREFWSRKWVVDVLRCAQSPLPPESHQRRTAEKLGGTYAEINAGHYPMLSHTNEIVRYLLDKA